MSGVLLHSPGSVAVGSGDLTSPVSSVDIEFETGVVFGNVIGFDVGPCRYTAVMEEPDFVLLEGTVTCENLSGPWSAER